MSHCANTTGGMRAPDGGTMAYYDELEHVIPNLIAASRRTAERLPAPEAQEALAQLDRLEKRFNRRFESGDKPGVRRVVEELRKLAQQLSTNHLDDTCEEG